MHCLQCHDPGKTVLMRVAWLWPASVCSAYVSLCAPCSMIIPWLPLTIPYQASACLIIMMIYSTVEKVKQD